MALEKINVPVVKNTRSSGLELLKGLRQTPIGICDWAIAMEIMKPRKTGWFGAFIASPRPLQGTPRL
jgi:hypothetical protein